jgi:hypothetical protein
VTASPAAVAAFDSQKSARWMRALLYGALWGAAVSVLESVTLPLRDQNWAGFWGMILWIAPGWCVVGVGIALLVEAAGARLEQPALLAGAVVASALAFSALWSWLYSFAARPNQARGMAALFPQGSEPVAAYLYQAWVVAFYGGLYVVAWTLNHRAERTRQVLAQAELARMQTETMLGEAQLQALRGHVDPAFLLRVMTEVEHRYSHAPESADRLMGLLVAVLRLAMTGVRSGQSTLAGELRLVRAYAELWSELEPARGTWTIAASEPLPRVVFPPLLLMPLLDRLADASPSSGRGHVSVTCADGAVVIRFDGGGREGAAWLTPELAYRVRVGLSTLFGSGWSMALRDARDTGDAALRLEIRRLEASSGEFSPG